jgi:phosphotransferase system HPr-like phosphotransfer protein
VVELKINLNIHGDGPVEHFNRTKEQRSKMKIKRLNVRVARRFRSRIQLRIGAEVADARNVMSILILISSLTSHLDIEASGDDEQEALQAVVEHLNHGPDRIA